jgi:hypothetical protein
MSSVRRLLGIVVLAMLTLGYLASQYAILYGDPVGYAARVDIPQVKYLSLFLFLAALVLAVIPDREEETP